MISEETAERLKCRIEEFLAKHEKQGKRKMKSYDEAAARLKFLLMEKSKKFRGKCND
jgi:hypothetical protein